MNFNVKHLVRTVALPLVGVISLAASTGLIHAQTEPYPIRAGGGNGGRGGVARISTDRGAYFVGDRLQFCWDVPNAGRVTIYDITPDRRTRVVESFWDDGYGGCENADVTPPTGRECLAISFDDGRYAIRTNGNGGGYDDEACFSVRY